MFKTLTAVATLLLASGALAEQIDAPQPLAEAITTPVGNVTDSPVLRVPMITWGGDMVTLLANGMSTRTQPDSPMAKAGLDLELVLQDNFDKQLKEYISGESPFLRCTIGMCNQALDLLNQDERTKPVVIYQLTWSRGGDTLVAKNDIMQVKELKGKTVAIQAYGPHVDFMTTLLQQAGMSMDDINIRWMPDLTLSPDSPPAVLNNADIDAAFMIISDAYGLTSGRRVGTGKSGSVEGARMIISTMYARRVIADIYVVRSDYFRDNRQKVKDFVDVLMQANDDLQPLMKDLRSPEKLALLEASADILLGDKEATPDIENLYYDAQFVDRAGNVSFLKDDTFPFRLGVLNGNIQRAFNDIGLIETTAPIIAADWDFSEF